MTGPFLALCLGLATLGPATAALARQTCAPHREIVHQLEQQQAETRRGIAMRPDHAVVELYAADTGRWTLIVTMPSGITCRLAEGQAPTRQAEGASRPRDPA
jgi:hypothetical protein